MWQLTNHDINIFTDCLLFDFAMFWGVKRSPKNHIQFYIVLLWCERHMNMNKVKYNMTIDTTDLEIMFLEDYNRLTGFCFVEGNFI